jgi:two-component system, cell cycle response regulator
MNTYMTSQHHDSKSVEMHAGELALKLLVLGFIQFEWQMLETVVKLSQRRQPRIKLLSDIEGEHADVVMIDAEDINAMNWANRQPWLQRKVIIWVDAQDAPGRTVVRRPIQWPILPMLLARALEQGSTTKMSAPASISGDRSVLVVDDSVAVRAQLCSQLESYGLRVTSVSSGEAAIRAAAISSYGCILMDVMMPCMSGYEACRAIKANANGGNGAHIVMLTGRTSPFDRIQGKMAGCDAYLTKPVDPDKLYEVISRFIAKPVESGVMPHLISDWQLAK